MDNVSPQSATYKVYGEQLKVIKDELDLIRGKQKEVNTLISQYDKEIESAQKDMVTIRRETELVNNTLSHLSSSSVRDIEYSIKIINEQLRGMDRGTAEFKNMTEQAKRLKTELAAVRNEGAAQQSWVNRTADWFNKMQGMAIGAIAAVTGLSFTIRKCTEDFADMDDEMTNVQKYTNQTKKEVREMNEDFKKVDTRTSREELNKLAEEAGRLGKTSKKDIEEFVDGADKIKVALGDDLGETAVRDIGKLAMMFGEDKTKGLRGAMYATGSAVNDLAQSSSAGAGYIVDFTARVAGIGMQAGLTQTQIMGLGSVLDQNMQQDEMAATAVSQLINKLFQDTGKMAKVAGLNVKEFSKTLKTDANAALLQFLQAMKSKGGFSALAPMFEDMKLDGQRATHRKPCLPL
jgi:archaellum component FlaC